MLEVNFATARPNEVFNAYIGADGETAIQLRQRKSGVFEFRTGDDTEWRTA